MPPECHDVRLVPLRQFSSAALLEVWQFPGTAIGLVPKQPEALLAESHVPDIDVWSASADALLRPPKKVATSEIALCWSGKSVL